MRIISTENISIHKLNFLKDRIRKFELYTIFKVYCYYIKLQKLSVKVNEHINLLEVDYFIEKESR